jgi:hypothetical protein
MMPVPKVWMTTARRLLAGHLDRLREFLGSWGRCLRERLAGAAGEAVTGVLRALLEDPSDAGSRPILPRHYSEWGTPSWRDPQGRPTEEQDQPSWRNADEDRWEDERSESVPTVAEEFPTTTGSRWRPTLAAALQALAWWLRRPTEELPARASLAAGITAGLALIAGWPLAGVAALSSSALGLLALTDAARNSAAALAAATSP